MRRLLDIALLVVGVSLLCQPASAASTERVSVRNNGAEANDGSEGGTRTVSADGRFVTFVSRATNLIASDTNAVDDVFVRDLLNGTTERISVNSAELQSNGGSSDPTISADGRFVAFESSADNLVTVDTNGSSDIFVRDRLNGTTEIVSVDSAEIEANSSSNDPSISADGRFVVFISFADNLIASDGNNSPDIYIRDRLNGTTQIVSVSSAEAEANEGSFDPTISADGRFVAFDSLASNLVAGDTNGDDDIFVRDLQAGTTVRVSVSSAEVQADERSSDPSISADGRYVAFESSARNLVAGDFNGEDDIFVRDRRTGTTQKVSVNSAEVQANNSSYDPSISADGRFVAFASLSFNLVPNDTNGYDDVFVRDRQLGITERISVSSAGVQGNFYSYIPSLSADGRFVAFLSEATNLIAGDTNGNPDIFLRDRGLLRDGQNDLLADFGTNGLRQWLNNSRWVTIHNASPLFIATGDLDGSFKDEAIATFAGQGLWARYNNATWTKLHAAVPARFTAGDLDGNGSDELIADFGASGIFARFNNAGAFLNLHPSTSQALAVGDLDGNGKDDLLADLSTGLWARFNNAGPWVRLQSNSPTFIATGDLDGSGKDEVIAAFGASGVYARFNNAGAFVRLTTSVAQGLATGDLDGSGRDELLVDFGSLGLRARYNNTGAFIRLTPTNPIRILATDLDNNGKAEAIASFPGTGLFARYNNAGAFVRLSPLIEQGIAVGGFD